MGALQSLNRVTTTGETRTHGAPIAACLLFKRRSAGGVSPVVAFLNLLCLCGAGSI